MRGVTVNAMHRELGSLWHNEGEVAEVTLILHLH